MYRLTALTLFLSLAGYGCEWWQQGEGVIKDLTNPLVMEGLLLGIQAPESDLIDIEGSEYEPGTGMTLLLADAANVNDLENAPVKGATVRLNGPAEGDWAASELGQGVYSIAPGLGPDYDAGAEWVVQVRIDGDTSKAFLNLPDSVDAGIAEEHDTDTAMDVDLRGQGFDSALVVVLEAESGEVTYSNEPDGIREFYDFTHGHDEVGVVTIPRSAFPTDSIYAVGVAGLVHTVADDLRDVNSVLSTVMYGEMVFSPVSTIVLY